MDFVILFLFLTIVLIVNSESVVDNFHTVSEKNVNNLKGKHDDTNDKGEKDHDEDKSVGTHAKEINAEIIEKIPKEDQVAAYKVHAEWFGRVKAREMKLENQLTLMANELKQLRPFLAIRKWIEKHEALLAPEFWDPKAVFKDISTQMDYHAAKWTKILEKTDVPMVQQLIRLLDAAEIPHKDFCRIIGGFFLIASGGIHVPTPTLKSYKPAEMENYLRDEFEINDDLTIKSVTEVLMKM